MKRYFLLAFLFSYSSTPKPRCSAPLLFADLYLLQLIQLSVSKPFPFSSFKKGRRKKEINPLTMSSAPQTQEKEVNGNVSNMDEQLRQVMSSTMTISPDIFEKLYLQPKGQVKGDLRKTFGNPTPLALIGFVVGLMPLSIQLMGWRGSGGGAIATTTDSIWFGGMLLILGGFLEFLLGNTFPFCVFMAYGCHFLTFATTTIPWFNAVAAYTNGASQTETPEFDAGFGKFNEKGRPPFFSPPSEKSDANKQKSRG